MKLPKFDGKPVRITLKNGAQFDGECSWNPREYMECEIGIDEEALQIDHWLFNKSDIKTVKCLKDGVPRLWDSLPMHTLHLAPGPYDLVDRGKKTIELRLNDEKRRKIAVGDILRFENAEDDDDVVFARVTALYSFGSFAELYRALPLEQCGYAAEELSAASPADMDRYYSPEEQRCRGVLGIRFELY